MIVADTLGPNAGSSLLSIIITAALSSMVSANADAAALAGSVIAGTCAVKLVLGNAYSRIGLERTQHSIVQIQGYSFAGKSTLAQCHGQRCR